MEIENLTRKDLKTLTKSQLIELILSLTLKEKATNQFLQFII